MVPTPGIDMRIRQAWLWCAIAASRQVSSATRVRTLLQVSSIEMTTAGSVTCKDAVSGLPLAGSVEACSTATVPVSLVLAGLPREFSFQRKDLAMELFVGLDVSLESIAICVLSSHGKVIKETTSSCEPEDLIGCLRALPRSVSCVGLEAGPLSQ